MGLLDDAIREHLELKRRRGADPAEVEKQEREALGPIGAAPVAEQAPVDAPLHDDEEPLLDDEPIAYDDGRVPLDDEREALRDHEPYDDDPDPFADAHQPLRDEPPAPPPLRDELPPERPRAPAPPREEPAPAPAQPTEQYSVEDLEEVRRAEEPAADDAPAEGEGEDVLDETPDFLQEAPEHDRLWFEQRPPRDFDF